MVGKGFRFYGRYEYVAKPNTTFNIVTLNQDGPNWVEFDDGTKIVFYYPFLKMKGMIMGDRSIKIDGCMTFIDIKNNLKAVIEYGNVSKKGGMWGSKKVHDLVKGKIY